MSDGTEIYNNLGRFPSVMDYQAQAQNLQSNRLAQMLQQAQVNEIPLHNQLNQLSLSQRQLEIERMRAAAAENAAWAAGGQQQPQAPQQPSVMAGAQGTTPSADPTSPMNPAMAHAPGQQQMPPGVARYQNMPLEQLRSRINYGLEPKDALELWKAANVGTAVTAGQYRILPGQSPQYMVDPKAPYTVGSDGAIGVAQGGPQALATVAGATKAGETAGANSQTPVPVDRLGLNGRPINQTIGQMVTAMGAPNPYAPQAPAAPPAVGGPTFQQSSPQSQNAILSDMARTGADPSQMTVNGHPIAQPRDMPALTAELQQAQASGPQAVAKYVADHQGTINNLPVSQRAQATNGFNTFLAHHGVDTSAASSSPFAGPADIAGQKLAAEQAVHATTDAPIQLGKDLLIKSHDANQKFVTDLGDVVNNEGEIVARNARLQPLLDQLPKLGGFGQDQRIEFANKLKNSGLMSQSTLDSLSNKIAGGDPDAAKQVQNQLSAAAIQTMLDTLNKEGKPNRVMYQALHEQQEGLDNGKPVLQGIMNLQKQLYDQHLGQYHSATDLMASPNYNPIRFGSQFATNKAASIQAGSGAPGAPPASGASPSSGFDSAAIAAELKRRGH